MSILSRVFRKPVNYVEHQVHKVKENIRAEVSEKVTKLILIMAMAGLMLFALLFASVGLAIYFNGLIESPTAGYWIVAGIYILGFIILFLLRNRTDIYRRLKSYTDIFMDGIG